MRFISKVGLVLLMLLMMVSSNSIITKKFNDDIIIANNINKVNLIITCSSNNNLLANIDAGSTPVIGVQLFLDFSPSSGRVDKLTPKPPLADFVFIKSFDNQTGEVDYAVGNFPAPWGSGFPVGDFEFLVIKATSGIAAEFAENSRVRKTLISGLDEKGKAVNVTGDLRIEECDVVS